MKFRLVKGGEIIRNEEDVLGENLCRLPTSVSPSGGVE